MKPDILSMTPEELTAVIPKLLDEIQQALFEKLFDLWEGKK